jgi:hypothetical protein
MMIKNYNLILVKKFANNLFVYFESSYDLFDILRYKKHIKFLDLFNNPLELLFI